MSQTLTTSTATSTHRRYGNFRDPVGLVARMLRSGNRAAYEALLRAGLGVGISPLDLLLQRVERRRVDSADPAGQTPPLLLIVGPPRSGSTLLYQTLARHLRVSYLSNLTALFPRSPLTATRLFQSGRLDGGTSLRSFYGQTAGLRSPNDGFEVWNRWLGGDRYQITEEFDRDTIDDVRRFFVAWTAQFDQPFLNKNNRNAHCLQLLARTLPAACFVVIRRNPLLVAQSLIEARVRVQGAKERSWGLASTDQHVEANKPLGYVDDVCDQILKIERRLQHQSAAVERERILDVTYEEFCRDPQSIVRRIVASVPQLQVRDENRLRRLEPFSASTTVRLSPLERQRIEQRLQEFPLAFPQRSSSRAEGNSSVG